MDEKKDINIDELLDEIRKDREQKFEEIFNKAKSRISALDGNQKVETENSDDKKETSENDEDIIAQILDETKETSSEDEKEVSDEEEPVEPEETGEITAEDTEEVLEETEEKQDEPSFKEMYKEKKQQKENNSKTRVFNKLKDGEAFVSSDHTKIKGQPDVGENEPEFEKEFKESRKEKIDNFRLFTESLTESSEYKEVEQDFVNPADMVKPKKGEDIFKVVDDVTKPKRENLKRLEIRKQRNSKVYDKIDVGRVRLELKNIADKNKSYLIVTVVFLCLFAIFEIVKGIYTAGKLPALTPFMTEKSYILYIIYGVLSIPVLAVSLDMFISRLKKSEKFSFNNELFLLVIFVCNVFHTVIQLICREEITKETLFFGLPLSIVLLLNILSDKKENKMISNNLNTIVKNERLLGIYSLGRETDKLAAGISNSSEPVILCSGEVEVPDSFMDSSTIKDKQNNFMKYAIPSMLLLSVVCAVIAKVTYGDLVSLSTAFMSAVLVTSPAYLSYVLVSLLSNANERLNRNGCEILGYEAVEYIDDTDAIVLDTAEIFSGEISKFHIINSRSPIDTVHAFEIVCGVIRESEGVLKSEVEGFIKEQNLKIPEVESLEYEEKLGLSCWVEDKRVLVGTRQMMIEHALEVPPEYTETAYKNEGKSIFYLAVDSMVIAMFCAEYYIGRTTRNQLNKIYGTGVILMLMTTDPHIDENFVSESIGVDASSIKTINATGMETIKKSIDKTAKQKRTGLIYKGNIIGLLRVINTAFRLYDVQSLAMLVQAISIGFGFAISAVLNIVATSFVISPMTIIIYHLLWTVLSLLMTRKK